MMRPILTIALSLCLSSSAFATIRFIGVPTTIEATEVENRHLVVYGGVTLTVEGTVNGTVTVLDGSFLDVIDGTINNAVGVVRPHS